MSTCTATPRSRRSNAGGNRIVARWTCSIAFGAARSFSARQSGRWNPWAPDRSEYVHANFADPASLSRFTTYLEGLPRLDVCVNNAGINIIKPLDAVSAADFDLTTAINYRAPYLVSQSAARVMRRAR